VAAVALLTPILLLPVVVVVVAVVAVASATLTAATVAVLEVLRVLPTATLAALAAMAVPATPEVQVAQAVPVVAPAQASVGPVELALLTAAPAPTVSVPEEQVALEVPQPNSPALPVLAAQLLSHGLIPL